MDYYDLVLGSIPVSLVGGTGFLGIVGIDLWTAVPIAALISLGVILHALFVRAPQPQPAVPTPEMNRPAPSSPASQPAD